jgi:transposase
MPRAVVRELLPTEEDELYLLLDHSNPDLARRARAILLVGRQGLGIREAARLVGASPATVRRWVRAFNAGGVGGLLPKRSAR